MPRLHIAPVIALAIILSTAALVVYEMRCERIRREKPPVVVYRPPAASEHEAEHGTPAAVRKDAPPATLLFRGFGNARYQRHDTLIRSLVGAFNRDRRAWSGATARQAREIPALPVALFKAQLIQESGGVTPESRAAWEIDPAQVNVPGDWTPYKRYLGLREPRHRNEGTPELNIRAAIKFLSRKGFGASGQPAANRAEAKFDGWHAALKRYNGRRDKRADGTLYCEFYADRIAERFRSPDVHVPIESASSAPHTIPQPVPWTSPRTPPARNPKKSHR